MRSLLAALFLMVAVPGRVGAWQSDLMPSDRIRGALLTLDYERPWAGLDLRQGRASGAIPVPGGIWCGGRVMALRAPTVTETGFGGWIVGRRWLLLAIDRVETEVEGLPPEGRTDGEVALQLHAGSLSFGWAVRAQGVQSPVTSVWRDWWIGLVTRGAQLAVGRRVTPWAVEPSWTVGVRIGLADGLDSALGWRQGEATLAISYAVPFARITAATGWTGPRSGGFGFRLRAGER